MGRPFGVMHTPNPDHPTHDLLLVAADAAGDLSDTDRPRAAAQLASCADCRSLHADLVALASATRDLPAPFARTRDFRLDAEDAGRLRRGSWLRNLLRPFGAAGTPVRPLAAAFTTLGLAGILVAGALPGLLTGSSASERDTTAGSGAAVPAATSAPANVAPQAANASPASADYGGAAISAAPVPGPTLAPAASDSAVKAGPSASRARALASPGDVAIRGSLGTSSAAQTASPVFAAEAQAAPAAPDPILVASLGLLAVGLVLFGLRFAGRRVR